MTQSDEFRLTLVPFAVVYFKKSHWFPSVCPYVALNIRIKKIYIYYKLVLWITFFIYYSTVIPSLVSKPKLCKYTDECSFNLKFYLNFSMK